MKEVNLKAWDHNVMAFWLKELGQPEALAEKMKANPEIYVRRFIQYFDAIQGKRILNPLGSCGKKSIPLALLGGRVTLVDFSESNEAYATAVAKAAGVDFTFARTDFFSFKSEEPFDYILSEGGILHYFTDLNALFAHYYDLTETGGKLILNDFHPFRKLLNDKDQFNKGEITLEGDYFETELHEAPVAYEKFMENSEDYPKTILRFWTLGEIVTAVAQAGYRIETLIEQPRFDEKKHIPGDFTIVARKE